MALWAWASLAHSLPLPDAQEGMVSAVFMPGWHRVDRVQLLTCWAAWLKFTLLPCSLPSSLCPSSIWPCGQGCTNERRLAFLCGPEAERTFLCNCKQTHIHNVGKLVISHLRSAGCLTGPEPKGRHRGVRAWAAFQAEPGQLEVTESSFNESKE